MKSLLCIGLLVILAVCCQDEIGIPSSSGKEEFSVEEAKEFFETNVDALSLDLQLCHAEAIKERNLVYINRCGT